MVEPTMIMYEEEFNHIQQVCDKLVRDANALVVFIVDKNGQLISTSGAYEHLDTTSLASLTAGNIAATAFPMDDVKRGLSLLIRNWRIHFYMVHLQSSNHELIGLTLGIDQSTHL